MEQPGYEKRGYLHEDFHLFHLCDAMREPVDWHYHTFLNPREKLTPSDDDVELFSLVTVD